MIKSDAKQLLHENKTFIETFAMGLIKKLEFWDYTAIIIFFVTDPFTNIVRTGFSETKQRIAWSVFYSLNTGRFVIWINVGRIGSVFCKFEWECSITGIFKLDTVLAKKNR